MNLVEAPADLVEEVREVLARAPGDLDAHAVAGALRARGRAVSGDLVRAVHDQLVRTSRGVGVLEPLVRDPAVTDVLVNGPGPVWVDRGRGVEPSPVVVEDEGEVRRLAQRLAALGGRRLDDAAPWCDLRLPDGTRFHAVLSPVARPGTLISLRVPRARAFTVAQLRSAGTLTPLGATVVEKVVERRLAALVSGGTGTGKTTLLATMLGLVPATDRIVVVEDSAELRPDHPHVVSLEARPANVEGAGAVDLRTLVRQALRMRPDRLVVGEVRGAEVVELLAAMNTGHEGGAGTVHANAATQVVARVEALGMMAGLERPAVASLFGAAVDVVLHLARGRDGRRRLTEVAVPHPAAGGVVRTETALALRPGADELGEGPAADRLADLLAR